MELHDMRAAIALQILEETLQDAEKAMRRRDPADARFHALRAWGMRHGYHMLDLITDEASEALQARIDTVLEYAQ